MADPVILAKTWKTLLPQQLSTTNTHYFWSKIAKKLNDRLRTDLLDEDVISQTPSRTTGQKRAFKKSGNNKKQIQPGSRRRLCKNNGQNYYCILLNTNYLQSNDGCYN